jgi:hypothetical protein
MNIDNINIISSNSNNNNGSYDIMERIAIAAVVVINALKSTQDFLGVKRHTNEADAFRNLQLKCQAVLVANSQNVHER